MNTLNSTLKQVIEKSKLTKVELINNHVQNNVPLVYYNNVECKLGEVIIEWADGKRIITSEKPILKGNNSCF